MSSKKVMRLEGCKWRQPKEMAGGKGWGPSVALVPMELSDSNCMRMQILSIWLQDNTTQPANHLLLHF